MKQPLYLARYLVPLGLFQKLAQMVFGQRIAAIISLTWKAAFRYRLFWVISLLLIGAVVGLPILIKDDGTAEGFAQILITYTLSAVTGLLGICTLWLACGTLARDVEDCQIQMVAVKPIARWQIWLGKWLGLVTLNAALLAVAGTSIYCLLEWRAQKLPPGLKARLQNEVLVSRGSAREESLDRLIDSETDKILAERAQKGKLDGVDLNGARKQLREQVKAAYQVVAPGGERPWVIHLGASKDLMKDQPLYLRVKFNAAAVASHLGTTYYALWQVGVPKKTRIYQNQEPMNLSADDFHEFPIPPFFDEKGDLTIVFRNINETALLFPLEDGMEVLYRQGGFGLNYLRGLGIILCWMALLAALGLASASFLSFPVAAFFSLAILVMCLSSGTLSTVVQEGTIMGFDSEHSTMGHTTADYVIVPAFRGFLEVVNLVQGFSPIDSLSTGRTITWTQLGLAVSQIVLLFSGILAVFGVAVFNRRELATAQGTS
jgi:hypothetical protein